MRYTPDGDPDDFDPTDPEMVEGFLDHPGNASTIEALGNEFRGLPAKEQIAGMEAVLTDFVEKRDQLTAMLANSPHDDPQHRLLAALDRHIDTYAKRIAELTEVPNHP